MRLFRSPPPPPAVQPGTLKVKPQFDPPRIRTLTYDQRELQEEEINDPETLKDAIRPGRVTWIDVQGLGNRDVLKQIEGQVDVVVKAEKLDLVLERSAGVVYFDESMDITQRVLELVNRSAKDSRAKGGPDAEKGKGTKKEPAAKKAPAPKKEGGGGK